MITASVKKELKTLTHFKPSVVFHIEKSHLICTTSQMTSFHIKRINGLKALKQCIIFSQRSQQET